MVAIILVFIIGIFIIILDSFLSHLQFYHVQQEVLDA